MFQNQKFRAIALLVASLTFSAAAAKADDDKSLGDLLLEKGYITEEELRSVEEEAAVVVPAPRPEPAPESEESDAKIRVDHKGLAIESADGDYVFAFGGRIQADAAVFIDDETSLGDGVELRRTRIKSNGTVAGDWDYKIEVNFDNDFAVSTTDAWLRYSGFEPFTVTVGHQKVPFSQQSMSSSNWQVFQERAQLDGFIDTSEQGRRRLGVVVGSYGEHWNAHGGVFGEGIDDAGTANNDWGIAGRAVWAPFAEKTKVLTFGSSIYYRKFENESQLRYRNRPLANIAGARLIDTGIMPNSKQTLQWNFETSFVCGRFHGQAEYTGSEVTRKRGQKDLSLGGWYVQTGVFLTGESRNYDVKSGKYKRIKPLNTYGAVEMAVRYGNTDLSDNGLRGGKAQGVTGGVNWWINQNIMMRFNYAYGDVSPNSSVVNLGLDEKIHAFTARTQVVF